MFVGSESANFRIGGILREPLTYAKSNYQAFGAICVNFRRALPCRVNRSGGLRSARRLITATEAVAFLD